MADENGVFRIVQASDIHTGGSLFIPDFIERFIQKTKQLRPDVVLIAGDLTSNGYRDEFERAAEYIERIPFPKLVIPGNHDARNVGFIHFKGLFGPSFKKMRIPFDGERASSMDATGCTFVGADSSNPDLNDGSIGFHRYGWIQDQYDHPDDIKVFVLHHHLVGMPGTGKERNICWDAGDVLALLTDLNIDMVISGHKHVPFFWDLNGILISNSSTVSTKRLRGLTPASFNEIEFRRDSIRVFLHYMEGERDLAMDFKRKTSRGGHEPFRVTDSFMEKNGFNKIVPLS